MTNLKYIESKFFYITSKHRQSGNINQFMLTFPNRLWYNSTNKKEFLKINLNDFSIIKEWYDIIDDVNNNFELNGSPLKVPVGSPTVYELLAYLNVLLLGQYTVTYNESQYTFTFVASNPSNTIKPINSGHLFGLVNGTTYTGSFDSVSIINIQWENSIYLCCDLSANGNNLDNLINTTMNASSIIGRVPINVKTGQTIVYNSFKNVNEAIQLSTMNGVDSLTFSVYTNQGRHIPLIYDYTFTLKVEHYQED